VTPGDNPTDQTNWGITYIVGDATRPFVKDGVNVIVHCVNAVGKWGAGFSGALSRAFPVVEQRYREWGPSGAAWASGPRQLGEIQMIHVPHSSTLVVVNLVGQYDVRSKQNPKPLDEGALLRGLRQVSVAIANLRDCRLHMPRIGAGLAGGSWETIEALILSAFASTRPEIFVYDLH
jgi:O-acetyl-ADP-ribose deacetylase (regulator of RNase III)